MLIYGLSDADLAAPAAGVGAAAAHLPTLPVTRFPLEQVAAAHDTVQQGTPGKVLLDLL
ncbi:hypothetical protein BH18ACT7_BH18ACT7_20220 [soil metagenome]